MSQAKIIPVILCFKWGVGYPCIYTNVLYRALCDVMNAPFRFVCMTDNPEGLNRGIDTIEIPEFTLDRAHWVPGMWPKLAGFKPDLFPLGTPVLMLDVDVIVLRDLEPLLDRVRETGALQIISDWPGFVERWRRKPVPNRRLSNSSVVGFIAGSTDSARIWERFRTLTPDKLAQISVNDQDFIHRTSTTLQNWPEGWVLSFKKSVAKVSLGNLFGKVKYPAQGYVVAFHGKPNPEDLAQPRFRRWGSCEVFGYFPVDWVAKYWRKYAAQAPSQD